MSQESSYSVGTDCLISDKVIIEHGAIICDRVIIDGENIIIQSLARIDAGSIVSGDLSIGTGAWVRAGSVVHESVPANAIVEGNPAQIVGYQASVHEGSLTQTKLVDIFSINDDTRPLVVNLGVELCALYLMRKIKDSRGSLSVGEVPTEVPFFPQRYFIVYDVPSRELRGEHAHRECEQFLICLHGSCRVLLDNGKDRCEVILDRPDMGVYMPAMIWGTQYRYSENAVLLVFASMAYNSDDYIRSYNEFVALKNNHLLRH
ncbi:WxcM-like domain-containing protein [Synechococcus sp. UW179A]|uniref:WxcM-like domain-containing protein n=1 Tax=Synechococcus sp. UW179A TaxID=2575510 RepID=UPI000E0F52B5|nr:WxcM-like domain-containing protein [Synechococcus sp. UW179A]